MCGDESFLFDRMDERIFDLSLSLYSNYKRNEGTFHHHTRHTSHHSITHIHRHEESIHALHGRIHRGGRPGRHSQN